MDSVSLTADDNAIRRVRSTGDVPESLPRPGRAQGSQRRSDGSGSTSLSIATTPTFGSIGTSSLRSSTTPDTLPSLVGSGSSTQRDGMPRPQAEQRPTTTQPRRPAERTGWVGMIMTFLGYDGPGARARRELLSMIFALSSYFVQFVVIVTLLAFSAHHESTTRPGVNEWDACGKPLGVWNSLWIIRLALVATLAYWGWRRDRARQAIVDQSRNRRDPELGDRDRIPPLPPFNSQARTNQTPPYDRYGTQGGRIPTQASEVILPNTHLYNRLSHLTSLMSLVWFLTAHVLEYTSVNTCRHSSPHLWWLTFGILCTLYLMILEIFILGLLVFILGPVLYLTWNLFLLCIGRHPLQNPHFIKPEIGKLSKTIVDQIPLVLYIPAPPDTEGSPITVPPSVYTYPPKPPAATPPKRRFAFLRRSKKGEASKTGNDDKNSKGKKASSEADKSKTWEDNWEHGEYPFVRLEGNRATCAICLMDFEEPKRVHGESTDQTNQETKDEQDTPVQEGAHEVQVDEVTEDDRLRLEDAGDGPQPLRLLACGHVFHQTCVDPWLIDVSGRCPVCQRAVETPKPPTKKRSGSS
ncbi:hypothetical protein QCA50_009579 [Cerrena zonata]|uniref:RING-type E3 ubiquitin transferase n=1 Tax=Cerrena zonata TaxID=2478898 RepID=A0AAW0G6M2_9APHY